MYCLKRRSTGEVRRRANGPTVMFRTAHEADQHRQDLPDGNKWYVAQMTPRDLAQVKRWHRRDGRLKHKTRR